MLVKIFDAVVAILGLILFLVTYPIIAIAIRLDSPGPVIYSQKRVGLRGRVFTFYKYRSMSHEGHKPYETPKLDHHHFKTFVFVTPTSRLTRVGRFLRATSLDELPNFWNVLKGDMRLVGPRPEIPELVHQYPPEYHRRHDVKPGITGLAQVERPRGFDVRRNDDLRSRLRKQSLAGTRSRYPVADVAGRDHAKGRTVAPRREASSRAFSRRTGCQPHCEVPGS